MHKDELVSLLKRNGKLVFTTREISGSMGLRGPALSNLLKSAEARGLVGKITRGKYYFKGAPINDIFAIASKIVSPSYVAMESAFERFGISTVIPKIIRIVATRAHRPIRTSEGSIIFIKFHRSRVFGYNESRWISISSLEKAFVDSMYMGEFPFFTDLVGYHKRLEDYGRSLNYDTVVKYTLMMHSKVIVNRMGFFLDYVGKKDKAEQLLDHIYKKRMVPIDNSHQGFFNNRKWMIK